MADSILTQLAGTGRNPVQEIQFQNELKRAGIPFEVRNGQAYVEGFGSGGNDFMDQARTFFSPEMVQTRVSQAAQQAQQDKLTQETRARENEFLGRVQGIPNALRGLETELGLPEARATYQSAGQGVRDVSSALRNIVPTQQTISKQVGISAPRLQQRIGAETAKLQPSVESATRGLEEAQAGLSGLLGAFQTRAENVIAPFQIEAGVMGESIKNQFDLFKTQVSNNLQRELALIQEKGLNDRAALDRANELAKIEKQLNNKSLTFQDLGNRVIAIDNSGREVTSFVKGLAPTNSATAAGKAYNPAGI